MDSQKLQRHDGRLNVLKGVGEPKVTEAATLRHHKAGECHPHMSFHNSNEWHINILRTKWKACHEGQNFRLLCSHTAATSPAGSPGVTGVIVENSSSEPSTDAAGLPHEEQTSRYVDLRIMQWFNLQ